MAINLFMESPTPWTYEYDKSNDIYIIVDASANDVAILAEGTDKKVADFIIKAVNSK